MADARAFLRDSESTEIKDVNPQEAQTLMLREAGFSTPGAPSGYVC